MNVELVPWQTPNFVIGKMPPRPRQEGIKFDGPQWSLEECDAETLAKMCDDFRAEIFRKAGKADPCPCNDTEELKKENDYLRWFWQQASSAFGSAAANLYAMYEEQYEVETGRKPLTRYQ